MKRKTVKVYEGTLIDEDGTLTLVELSERCMISENEIAELVYEGVIHPVRMQEESWHFTRETLWRIKKVKRLRRDLELNLSGAALTMQLLDRIEELENMLKRSML